MLVGLVLGLAIYNAVLLDFPLPLALYRKLIGQSCTLRDLQDMEPTLGKSLNALLQYEGKAQSQLLHCGTDWHVRFDIVLAQCWSYKTWSLPLANPSMHSCSMKVCHPP